MTYHQFVIIFRLITNSELVVAPNSDHLFPSTKVDLYFTLISDFLQI